MMRLTFVVPKGGGEPRASLQVFGPGSSEGDTGLLRLTEFTVAMIVRGACSLPQSSISLTS